MAKLIDLQIVVILLSFFCIRFSYGFVDTRKVYIVYMGALPTTGYSASESHQNILQQVLENSMPSESLICSYKRSFNGFAANLTEKERNKLTSMEGIVSVFPSETYKLHTTRSWDFMGLSEKVKRVPKVESDIIVGVIDSGIWPESESFSDEGIGEIPKKWKGSCEGGKRFTCNKKVIGARFYEPSNTARDYLGHGTHTASTASGNQVRNVSFYGLAHGDAKGGVPSTRIVVYKACSEDSCGYHGIMAAFDDAISDGVDILSVSVGTEQAIPIMYDPISIGSFHAMEKGILTSQSAGNSGPQLGTVSSVSPWLLSVAASSIDRKIMDKVILGDNTLIPGLALNSFSTTKKLPLVKSTSGTPNLNTWEEYKNKLQTQYEGKIVFYENFDEAELGINVNASGIILVSDRYQGFSFSYPLPASLLSTSDAGILKSYMEATRHSVASILKSEVLNDSSAPVVPPFSSRGPNAIYRDILKPDITAPGTDIIAAWPPEVPPTDDKRDKRSIKYNIMSGTSVSCPHVTGAAAYVKTFHPDWSPSAIKSALMTTAFPLNATRNPDVEFAYGAGQIDPVKAVSPGLVYDSDKNDYIKLLCNMYSLDLVRRITGDKHTTCPKVKLLPKDLNYPSMATTFGNTNFTRTVTNVGMANSTYNAIITAPPNVKVRVEPNILSFKSLNQKKMFVVTVSSTPIQTQTEAPLISSASLVWSDGIHRVRSAIVVSVNEN